MGAVVLGISTDSVGKQAKFRDIYSLNMPLLSDFEKKTISAYGVYKEKQMYGKTVKGIERTTFIIGKDGIIRKIFPKVKVEGHVEEVLQVLESLQKSL
jgi:thioredoxin-dependent peroxiredoxin